MRAPSAAFHTQSDLVELFNTHVRPKLQAPQPKAIRGGVPRVNNQAEAEALAEQIREREEVKAAKRGAADVAGPAAAVVVSPPLDRHQEAPEAAAASASHTVDRNFNIFQVRYLRRAAHPCLRSSDVVAGNLPRRRPRSYSRAAARLLARRRKWCAALVAAPPHGIRRRPTRAPWYAALGWDSVVTLS